MSRERINEPNIANPTPYETGQEVLLHTLKRKITQEGMRRMFCVTQTASVARVVAQGKTTWAIEVTVNPHAQIPTQRHATFTWDPAQVGPKCYSKRQQPLWIGGYDGPFPIVSLAEFREL